MKILIVGAPGAGKSAVVQELIKNGYVAYDTDEITDLTRWEDKSGQPVERLNDPPADWFDHHDCNWNRQKIKQLLSNTDTVFVCGSSSNQREIFEMFDRVVLLHIDEATLRHRLNNRVSNDFGKHPNELSSILSWFEWFQKDIIAYGAVIVDATQPLKKVMSSILDTIK